MTIDRYRLLFILGILSLVALACAVQMPAVTLNEDAVAQAAHQTLEAERITQDAALQQTQVVLALTPLNTSTPMPTSTFTVTFTPTPTIYLSPTLTSTLMPTVTQWPTPTSSPYPTATVYQTPQPTRLQGEHYRVVIAEDKKSGRVKIYPVNVKGNGPDLNSSGIGFVYNGDIVIVHQLYYRKSWEITVVEGQDSGTSGWLRYKPGLDLVPAND